MTYPLSNNDNKHTFLFSFNIFPFLFLLKLQCNDFDFGLCQPMKKTLLSFANLLQNRENKKLKSFFAALCMSFVSFFLKGN